MNKKVMLYFISLVWVAVLLQLVVVFGTKNDAKVVQAFQTVDSVPLQSIVTATGTYGEYLVAEQTQEKLCQYIAKGLGITSYQTTKQEVDGRQELVFSSSNDTAKTTIILWEQEQKQHITTTVTLDQNVDSVVAVKERVEKVYRRLKMEPEVNFYMKGALAGQMQEERMEQIKNQIFQVLETKTVKYQICSDANMFYGFSQRLKDSRKINDKKVNVQLVFTYNEEKQQTELYLGVPVYNEGF